MYTVKGQIEPESCIVLVVAMDVAPDEIPPEPPFDSDWVSATSCGMCIRVDREVSQLSYTISVADGLPDSPLEARSASFQSEIRARYVRVQSLTGGESSPCIFVPDASDCRISVSPPDRAGKSEMEINFTALASPA